MKKICSRAFFWFWAFGFCPSWAKSQSEIYSATREFLVRRYAAILTSSFPLNHFPESFSPNENLEAARLSFVIKSLTYLGRQDLSMQKELLILRRSEARQEFRRRLSPVIGRLGEALFEFAEGSYSSEQSVHEFEFWFFDRLQNLEGETHSRILLLTEEKTGIYLYKVIQKAGLGMGELVRKDLQKLSSAFVHNLFEEVLMRSFSIAEKEWKIIPQVWNKGPVLSFATSCRFLDLQGPGRPLNQLEHPLIGAPGNSPRLTSPGHSSLKLIKNEQ